MSDVPLPNVGHQNAPTRDELLAASAITQFYIFASRCMDWASTTRSLQERAVYVQMGLRWLAALRLKNSHVARSASDKEGTTHQALSRDGEHGAPSSTRRSANKFEELQPIAGTACCVQCGRIGNLNHLLAT